MSSKQHWKKLLTPNQISIFILVRDNDYSYSDLRRIVVDEEKLMGKPTFQKNIKKLVKDGMIIPYADEKHKQIIRYYVPYRTPLPDDKTDSGNFEFLEEYVQRLNFVRTIYPRLPSEQKIDVMIEACHSLQVARIHFEANNLATHGKPVRTKTHRLLRKKYDELFTMAYEIINSDRDASIIIPSLQTDTLYQDVPDIKLVDVALELCFKNIRNDRKNDKLLLVLKDANGKAIKPLNKKEYEDFKKGVKKREELRDKDKDKDKTLKLKFV